jgi:hypothetical protein
MSEPRKLFSYAEAQALVPEVRRLTGQAQRALAASGLDPRQPDPDQGREVLGRWAAEVQRLGLTVKGPWLVDFDNGSGYYCWRYPEPSLLYWHSYSAGLAGRLPIQ